MLHRVTLLGRDHTELGEVVSGAVGEIVGVALSRGRFPKGYPHTEPNEDAVFAAVDDDVAVLVVADGHNGFAGVAAAVGAVNAIVEEILQHGVADAESAASRAVFAAAAAVTALERPCGLALTVAVINGRSGVIAGFGDTYAVVAGRRAQRLGEATDFLRCGEEPAAPSMVRVTIADSEVLALMSDGIVDYAGRRALRAVAAAARGRNPLDSAEALIQLAFAGGAGDNLAAAVLTPRMPSR